MLANFHEQKRIISEAISQVKQSEVAAKLCQDAGFNIENLTLIPVTFSNISTSAKTEKGIIYLNKALLTEPKEIPPYLIHEFKHWFDQCLSDSPTKGSNDQNYLDNEFEQAGFRAQTEFLSETRGDEVAEKYIDKVLDHHEVKGKEREERKEQLLQLAKSAGLLKHDIDLLDKMTSWTQGLVASRVLSRISQLFQPKYAEKAREHFDVLSDIAGQVDTAITEFNDLINNLNDLPRQIVITDPAPKKWHLKLKIDFDVEAGDEARNDPRSWEESDFAISIQANKDGPYGTDVNNTSRGRSLEEVHKFLDKFNKNFMVALSAYHEELKQEVDLLEASLMPEVKVNLALVARECKKYPVPDKVSFKDTVEKKFGDTKLVLFFNHQKANVLARGTEWIALWHDKSEIWLKVDDTPPDTVDDFHQIMNDYRNSLRHELQHKKQTDIKKQIQEPLLEQEAILRRDPKKHDEWWHAYLLADSVEPGGLPSKKYRHPDYDSDGDMVSNVLHVSPDKKQKFITKQKRQGYNKRVDHSLRDIEFYTDLTDSINRFRNKFGKFPLEVQEKAAKVWTSSKTFFDQKMDAIEFDAKLLPVDYNRLYNQFRGDYFFRTLLAEYSRHFFNVKAHLSALQREQTKLEELKNKGNSPESIENGEIDVARIQDAIKGYQDLAQRSLGKYQKAIKEFYKAIFNQDSQSTDDQLSIKFPRQDVKKSQKELMQEFEEAIKRGPDMRQHKRPAIFKQRIHPRQQEERLQQLKNILEILKDK